MDATDFSLNLKLLCAYEKSVSEVCRSIDINRQQFNKYLNGTSKPSPFNLQRICGYFQVHVADVHLPHDEFADRMQFRAGNRATTHDRHPQHILKQAFPGDLRTLRRYLGYYFTHYHSFSWAGYILRSLTCLYEQGGMILSKTIDRVNDPVTGALYLSKYDGYVSLLGNRIFVLEFQSLAEDAIVETVLDPAGRSQLTLLRGVTFGLSSKHRKPYVARAVWKYLGRTVDHRLAISAIGVTPIHSPTLDSNIVKIIGDAPFPNEHLHYDLEQPVGSVER